MKTISPNAMRFCVIAAVITCVFSNQPAFSQTGVKIAATAGTAHPSAMLDVESTSKGVLVPRMNSSQRAAISGPAEGLIVYQTDAPSGYWYYNGSAWIQMGVGAISGSGTTNFVPKWTTANSQGNSTITDDGTTVTTSGQFDVTGGTGTNYITSPIEIRTTNNPRLSFHWPGVVASQIGMDAAGVIRTYNNPGTGYEAFAAANITANGNINNAGILYQNTSSGQGSGAHGISWYTPSYTTWYDYMCPAGGTNAPSGTAAPSDATSGVTSWALRSNIENAGGYGWIWESGLNGAGQAPTVKFSINSNNGSFHSVGNGYIDGTLRIAGGSPAAGRVLTSDASGNATWTVPAAGGSDNLGNHTATTSLNMAGNAINNMQALNSVGDHIEFMSGVHADDNTYEWLGFYSGGTRQGIFLYDGAWTGANNVANEFSLTAEQNNLLTLNSTNNHIALMPKGGNVGIGTLGPGQKLEVIGNIRSSAETFTQNWFRNQQGGVGLYNEATGAGIYSPSGNLMTLYGSSSLQITSGQTTAGNLRFDTGNPYITTGTNSYFVAPGGAYFSSNTVYTEAAIQERGGVSNDGGNFGGDVQVNESLRVAGAINCIQGQCPPNSAIRVTPNLHLNSGAGYAVILNWDNGTTGTSQTLRIGNGASADVFQVLANGNTGIGTAPGSQKLFSYEPSGTGGGGYATSTVNAVMGQGAAGSSSYAYGVTGYQIGGGVRSGGVHGAYSSATWGALGYVSSASTTYGLWYTSAGSGAGFLPQGNARAGVGAGGVGEFIGSWTRGGIIGNISAGELAAGYNVGNVYTSGHNVEIVDNGSERVAAYSNTSTEATISKAGKAQLVNGKAAIQFDEKFTALLDKEEDPVVTITPIGNCNGIHLVKVSSSGFEVEENNSGTSTLQFTYIVMGKRVDASSATLPADLSAKNFDENLKGFMFNESNTEQSAKPMWWDGNKIRFDAIPAELTRKEEPKPSDDSKAQTAKVNELIQSAAKNQAVVNRAADAPTLEKLPAKSTVQEPAPVLVSPVGEEHKD